MTLNQLEPINVWKHFAALNAIPRASKKEAKVCEHIIELAKKYALNYKQDEIGNIVIYKPGQGNAAHKEPIALQAHLDMVHQKNSDVVFDFDSEGIQMVIDGEWVKANGTTLGADNGIGVANLLALLDEKQLNHPPLELLFTIDEEAGMTGAKNLGKDLLMAKRLINLDTEDEDEITIGCAGGIDTFGQLSYTPESVTENTKSYFISVSGLKGGHSGMDIHLGGGNAVKILNRLLWDTFHNFGLRINSINAGGLRNAIPREGFASVAIEITRISQFENHFTELSNAIISELEIAEPNLKIQLESTANVNHVMPISVQVNMLRSVYCIPNGVFRMSDNIKGLVETSNNLARWIVKDGEIRIECLQRSSIESAKKDIANQVSAALASMNCKIEQKGDYPGWKPNNNSELLKFTHETFFKFYRKEPIINAVHAGLECGIIQSHYPDLDMVSIGPNIRNAHAPDEKVEIASVSKVWRFLNELLDKI